MKKTILFIVSVFSLLFLDGCQKDPFVSKEVIQHIKDSIAGTKSVGNICFIYNNDVYFLDEFNNTPQKITNTPLVVKSEVRISHDLQKIAYLNAAGNPEIIDRNGTIINTLTSYSGILQMDWSNDDATLYMLIADQFYYYGPTISHPLLNFSGIPGGSSPHILSATLSANNDLAYVVDYFDFTYGYLQKLVLKKNDGTGTWVIVDNPYYPYKMKYAKFSTHDKDLVVGYGYSSTISNSRLELYTNMNSYPDQIVEPCTDCEFKSPIYRSDKKCIVSAFKDGSSTSTNFLLSAYFYGDVTRTDRLEYNSITTNLVVDWK
jgi:hypothetical protein